MTEPAKDPLRFDRRLFGRRGRIEPDELAQVLEQLPDVAEKGELVEAPAAPPRREPAPHDG